MLLRAEASAVDGHKLVGILSLNWLILVLVPVLAAVAGYFVSDLQAEVYESRATLLIQPTAAQVRLGQESRSSLDADRELDTQEALLNSSLMSSLVEDEIDGDAEFEAEREFGTDLLYIIFSAETPDSADAGADTVAEIYLTRRTSQERLELEAAVEALSIPIQQLETRLNDVSVRIDNAGGPELAGSTLISERDALTVELASARGSSEQLRLEAAVTTGGARLLAAASGADVPVAPKPARSAAIWFVLGVVLAIAMVWLREQFDDGLLGQPAVDET